MHGRLTPSLLRLFLSLLLLSTVLGSSACSRKISTLPTPEETEASIATLYWLDNVYGVISKHDLNRLLHRVTDRVASSVNERSLEEFIPESVAQEYKDFSWQVYALEAEEPNAFSAGSGVILLSRGLINTLGTEAELAAVIAHEMAHQLLGHTRVALAKARKDATAPEFAYDLGQELEADSLCVKMLKIARYDLRAAPYALTLIYRKNPMLVSQTPPDWLRERQANLKRQVSETKNVMPATLNTREFVRVQQLLRDFS